MISPRFSALKTSDGWFKVIEEDRLKGYLSRLPDQLSLVLRPLKKDRSNNQNAYYWGVVLKIISDDTGNSAEDMHEYLKALFLVKRITVNGKDVEVIKSTANLTTKDFEEYLEAIRRWAALELKISIPLPNEVDYQ